MTPIQQRDIIRQVRQQWTEQYRGWDSKKVIGMGDAAEPIGIIRKRLSALDLETCSAADVDKALGTTGWVDNQCDECRKSFPVVIRLGGEPGIDERWQDICPNCLEKAVTMAAKTKPLK